MAFRHATGTTRGSIMRVGCTFDLWADDVPICAVELLAGTKYGIFASSRNGRDAGIAGARGTLHRDFWIYCSNPWNLR
jgi:hypothetical protein